MSWAWRARAAPSGSAARAADRIIMGIMRNLRRESVLPDRAADGRAYSSRRDAVYNTPRREELRDGPGVRPAGREGPMGRPTTIATARRARRAFTLLELLVVIAIIGVLLALLV